MKLDFQAIKDDFKRLRSARRRPKVFGAESHEYKLNPRLTEEAVQRFERAYAIRLPEDYRKFLLEVGNGGAGPCYGIFKLGEMDDGWGHSLRKENDGFIAQKNQEEND